MAGSRESEKDVMPAVEVMAQRYRRAETATWMLGPLPSAEGAQDNTAAVGNLCASVV